MQCSHNYLLKPVRIICNVKAFAAGLNERDVGAEIVTGSSAVRAGLEANAATIACARHDHALAVGSVTTARAINKE
jgi:hypothetical protein